MAESQSPEPARETIDGQSPAQAAQTLGRLPPEQIETLRVFSMVTLFVHIN